MTSWVYVLRLVMICQRAAEIWANFLLGGFAVKFDWLSRLNGFEFDKSVRYVLSSMAGWSCLLRFTMIKQNLWWGFWHTPRWRKIHHGAKRQYRVRWTRLGSRNPMIPCLWILDERVESYKHECMSNFDLLVTLELMGQRPQICFMAQWDYPEPVCQTSQLFTKVFYGLP